MLPINATTVGLAIALAIGASFGLYRLLGSSSLVVEEKKDQGQQQQSAEDKIEGTTRFVMEYPGGPCFYVKPLQITDNSALLEGYGVTTAPFSRLDTAFRDKAGFEADIGVHEIAAAQCPAIALLGTLQNAQAAAPKIALSSSALKLGQDLVGIIRGIAGRQVDLLLVADDGTVRLLTSTPYPSTEEKMPFRAKLGPELANGKLQLLVAIASPKPMSIIPNDTSVAADKFFPRVLADAKTAGLSLVANASSFRLDK